MIKIADKIFIREDELVFKTSRSSGPGGQNVNKLNTRVTLLFDVANCASLSGIQKQHILESLARRADKNGVIRIISQKYRTQNANRKEAIERLKILLKEALKTKPVRKKTKIPIESKQKRLEQKRRRSLLKQQRAKKSWADSLTA